MHEDADTSPRSASDDESKIDRRDILSGIGLGAAGAAAGVSFWFKNEERRTAPDLKSFERDDMLVRTGHIGVGNRGGSLLRTALQVPGSYPVAVCDRLESKRNDTKKSIDKRLLARRQEHGMQVPQVKAYDDYRRLLDDKDVEAVFIATPHYLHGPMAIDAIEAGKHVYCEKALAYTISENIDIVERVEAGAKTSDGADLVFQVGHQRHYSPIYRRVGHMVASDQIGDLVTMRAHWNLNDSIRRPVKSLDLERIINWRLYSEYSGGLTTEYATHQIDLANWYFDVEPYSVCGVGGVDYYRDGRDTTDNCHLIISYKVPIPRRDPFGRIEWEDEAALKPKYELGPDNRPVTRTCTFDYMSSMANSYLSPPKELLLGRYGTIGVSLAGGEFFKEKKAREDINRIAEGTNPRRARQKTILKSGVTVATAGAKAGDPIAEEELPGGKKHWSHFIEPIDGAYDKAETLLAVESFHECVRRARAGKPFADKLKATARVGMLAAVPALMANMAMRDEKTYYWKEFFPKPQV